MHDCIAVVTFHVGLPYGENQQWLENRGRNPIASLVVGFLR